MSQLGLVRETYGINNTRYNISWQHKLDEDAKRNIKKTVAKEISHSQEAKTLIIVYA